MRTTAHAGWVGLGLVLSVIWPIIVIGVLVYQFDTAVAEMGRGVTAGYQSFFVTCAYSGRELFECDVNQVRFVFAASAPLIVGWSVAIPVAFKRTNAGSADGKPEREKKRNR